MNEKSRAIAAMGAGAVVGAVAGYMFFTDSGRTLRRQLEPALEDIARELSHFRGTVQKAAGVASDGWKLLNDALGEHGEPGEPRFQTPHQSSPF